jgi:SanA protein
MTEETIIKEIAADKGRFFVRKRLRSFLLLGVIISLAGVGAFLLISGRMADYGRERIYSVDSAPERRVAVVFGARVYKDGRPSRPLRYRLNIALELYLAGKVEKILVSGDNGRRIYNEPENMRDWLIERGAKPEDVACDYAGFRTLDTCARVGRLWSLRKPILVSQSYHLPRALYLADAFGMEGAVGVAADGPGCTRKRDQLRETAARVAAWLDVNILAREPKFWGPRETI